MTQPLLVLLLCLIGAAAIGFATGYFLGWLGEMAAAAWSVGVALLTIVYGLYGFDDQVKGLQTDLLFLGLHPESELDLE